jgi:hypothetical protein
MSEVITQQKYNVGETVNLTAKIKSVSKPYGENYCYTVEIEGRAIHDCQLCPKGVDVMERGLNK